VVVMVVVVVAMVVRVVMVVVPVQRQPRKGLGHHRCVQVAALAGVDLDRRRAGGADAVGVVRGLLVAFDHRQRQLRRAPHAARGWWRTAAWSCPTRGWTPG
jgi:hypothetical protein